MNKHSKEFKELVYDLVNGALDLEEYPVEESKYVKNEYEEDGLCAKLYSDMRDAYDRVCARLGKPGAEDRDLDIMVDSLLKIDRYTSMKMYEYGWHFAAQNEESGEDAPVQEQPAEQPAE